MTCTKLYNTEVAVVVFVDASHPDQFARFREATGNVLEASAQLPQIGADLALARFAVRRWSTRRDWRLTGHEMMNEGERGGPPSARTITQARARRGSPKATRAIWLANNTTPARKSAAPM